ncbi:MAG: alpha/beta hydrolase [Roseovarius sp.]|uniref:alpha/beta hydrolase n=1 Tax=Roseovarius sp. TaxID=1486281 RepID=UPI0032EABAC5
MTHHLPHTYLEDRLVHPDGTRIFYRSWRPAAGARAVVVICHGFNSHGGQYAGPAEALAAAGFHVYALDLRGRGRSDGPRFRVGSIADYVADLRAVIDLARSRDPGLGVFLLGHSAGGVVATTYALDHGASLAGLVCESFAFRVPAPKAVLALIKGLGRLFPALPVLTLKTRDFTRDRTALGRLNADPMTRDETQPAETVAAMVRGNGRLAREFGRITLPLLILHGTRDKVTLPAGSEAFARAAGSGDKTLKLYDGHYHDLLADLGKEAVLQDIIDWIVPRIPR